MKERFMKADISPVENSKNKNKTKRYISGKFLLN